MKLSEWLKSTFVTGLLLILPGWLAILLMLHLFAKLQVLVQPISKHLPEAIDHPALIAAVLIVLACLIAGILFQTSIGKAIGRGIETLFLSRVPGYFALRNITNQAKSFESTEGFTPAMIEIEDGSLAPGFLIEVHSRNRVSVFIPSAPTPLAGNILVMPRERVHLIEVSVASMMKCISRWGTGSQELVAAYDASQTSPSSKN